MLVPLAPIWRHNDVKSIVQNLRLKHSIDFSRRCETWASIYLDQPWLQVIVDQYVKAIHFEAVFVVNYYALHRLKTDVDYVLNTFEKFVALFFSSCLLNVEP